MDVFALKDWRVFPPQDEWSIPLLRNMLEIRNDKWEAVYDDETGECVTDDELDFLMNAICTG